MSEKTVEKKDSTVVKKNLRYQRDKDREKVRGIFRYHEVPGGSMKFMYRVYKEDQIEKYELIDGQIYTLPLGVAKHLNKNCWYPVHAFAQNEDGSASSKIGKRVQRCAFQSLEFVDLDEFDASKEIVTVENVL